MSSATEPWQLSAIEGSARIAAGTLDAGDWMSSILSRIALADPLISAFVQLEDREALIAKAHAAGHRIKTQGPRSPIDGAPFGLKDSIDQVGKVTTGCSRLLMNQPPASADAEPVKMLHLAGALSLGRQTLYELNYGGPSFDLPSKPARNPWNLARIPGGSSSGSAAAVAAGCGPIAVGSDAGGSIRQPASFCGVVGLKASAGSISRQGVLPMSLTLGDPGPLARTIDDCSAVFDAISGENSFSRRELDVRGLRFAVPESFAGFASPAVLNGMEQAALALERAGLTRASLEVSPDAQLLDAVGRVILLAEAFAVHEQDLVAHPHLYGEIARHRFCLGAFLSASDVVQAQRRRASLTAAMNLCLNSADLLLLPGEANIAPAFEDASESFPFTSTPSLRIGFNVTGHPALAVPSGFGPDAMPIAVQFAAQMGREDMIFAAGRIVERQAGVIERWPDFRRA
jgi:aspartyl-tRNA(Asn)/glutamyl-tRNA(Gln) amidotransferase subunit A